MVIHLKAISEFDDGLIPKPVVADEEYYLDASRDEGGGY